MENIDKTYKKQNLVPDETPQVPFSPNSGVTLNSTTPSAATGAAGTPPAQSAPPKQASDKVKPANKLPLKFTPLLKILLVVLSILFLMVFFVMLLPKKTVVSPNAPSPTPVVLASPSPEVKISEFAKTEIFGQFEVQMASVSAHLSETDLNEDKLTFPLLDMDVNFDK